MVSNKWITSFKGEQGKRDSIVVVARPNTPLYRVEKVSVNEKQALLLDRSLSLNLEFNNVQFSYNSNRTNNDQFRNC